MRDLRSLAIGLLICFPAVFVSAGFAQTETAPGAAPPPAAGEAVPPAPAASPSPTAPPAPEAGAEEAAAPAEGTDEGPVEFTAAYLEDTAILTTGKEVWDTTCQSCHGAKAYPGKGPKLKPAKYTPEFVFDRVTNGFRKMPAWKDVFTKEERMAVSAYVKSRKFSP